MTCVSYHESLEELDLVHCAMYGVSLGCTPDVGCNDVWSASRRSWWQERLNKAETRLTRELGSPICPRQIYQERHMLRSEIHLKQKPVAYLGLRSVTEIGLETVTYPGVIGPATFADCITVSGEIYIDPTTLPAGVAYTDLVFRYPEDYCYGHNMELQEPCFTDDTGGSGNWVFSWNKCQLLQPTVDSSKITDDPNFLTDVWVGYESTDESQALEVPPGCGCVPNQNDVTLSIGDERTGLICLDGCDPPRNTIVYVNYGTSFLAGESDVATDLSLAIVLLALTMTGHRRLCSCTDFDETVTYWLETDDAANRALVTPNMLPYGPSRAGMEVARIMDTVLKRPHFNEPRQDTATAGHFRSLPHRRSTRGW